MIRYEEKLRTLFQVHLNIRNWPFLLFFHREQDARITALQSEKEYVLFFTLLEILINNQILSSMQLTGHNDALEKNRTRKEEQAFQKSNCSWLRRFDHYFKSYHVS